MTASIDKHYRKKPVVIEAVQWRRQGDHPAVSRLNDPDPLDCEKCGKPYKEHGAIRTLEDTDNSAHIVCPADWIIKGVKGEHYACKPDIFAATYEPASTPSATETHDIAPVGEMAAFWANLPDGATDRLNAAGAKHLAQSYLDILADYLRVHKEKCDLLFTRSSVGPNDELRMQSLSYMQAALKYTENFYAVAMEHGMKRADTANRMAHLERAIRRLHDIAIEALDRENAARSATRANVIEECAKEIDGIAANASTQEWLDAMTHVAKHLRSLARSDGTVKP